MIKDIKRKGGPLKKGDRVRVYAHNHDFRNQEASASDGTITCVAPGGLQIHFDGAGEKADWLFHPRQCVRLIKKPKQPRVLDERRFFLNSFPDVIGACYDSKKKAIDSTDRHDRILLTLGVVAEERFDK